VTAKFSGPQLIRQSEMMFSILSFLDSMHSCIGIKGYESIHTAQQGHKISHSWFSNKCEGVSDSVICTSCKLFSQSLYQSLLRPLPSPKPEISKIQKKNRYYRRRVKYLVKRQRNTKAELLRLRVAVTQLDLSTLISNLDELKFEHGMKMTIVEAVRAAKAKSSKGMRLVC